MTRRRAPITCPACEGVADAVTSGMIEYDRCRSCGGVWLDCGELEVLIALAHRSGRERAARASTARTPEGLAA